MKNYIAKIRQSDEPTRKRWLVALSVAAGLLVVSAWLVHLNATIIAVAPPVGEQIARQPKIFPAFQVGLSAAGEKTAIGLANSYVFFREKISSKNKFIISRANQNFIWDDLEKLPERQLP